MDVRSQCERLACMLRGKSFQQQPSHANFVLIESTRCSVVLARVHNALCELTWLLRRHADHRKELLSEFAWGRELGVVQLGGYLDTLARQGNDEDERIREAVAMLRRALDVVRQETEEAEEAENDLNCLEHEWDTGGSVMVFLAPTPALCAAYRAAGDLLDLLDEVESRVCVTTIDYTAVEDVARSPWDNLNDPETLNELDMFLKKIPGLGFATSASCLTPRSFAEKTATEPLKPQSACAFLRPAKQAKRITIDMVHFTIEIDGQHAAMSNKRQRDALAAFGRLVEAEGHPLTSEALGYSRAGRSLQLHLPAFVCEYIESTKGKGDPGYQVQPPVERPVIHLRSR